MLVPTLILAAIVAYNTAPPAPSLLYPAAYCALVWLGVVALFILALVVIELVAAVMGAIFRLILPS
jgi:hypothetical protein